MKKISLFKGRYLAALLLLPVILITGSSKAAAASSSKTKIVKHKTITKIVKKKKTKRNKNILVHRAAYKRLNNGELVRYVIKVDAPAPTATAPSAPVASTPPPAPVITPQAGYSIDGIINAINEQRQANGLSAVRTNSLLNQAAAEKSVDMSKQNYFAHSNPQGKSDFAFIDEVGYHYQSAGSNLAVGDFGSNEALVNAWMNSPGHRANILAPFGQEIGIGISGNYFTMFIAKPM